MPQEQTTERRTADAPADAVAMAPWGLLAVALVVGGLLLSARAGDEYTMVAGLLFAGFGAFLGFRALGRLLP